MWTLERLQQVAVERGETADAAKALAAVMLAHERARGRTEEIYSREVAEKELGKLFGDVVPTLQGDLVGEYVGFQQLRKHIEGLVVGKANDGRLLSLKENTPVYVERVDDRGGLVEGDCDSEDNERDRR